jgi:DNA-binding transcriptional regulator PaaX
MVAGAWDFERINRRYVRHLKILEERPGNALGNVAAAKALLRWSATEREAWLDAVTNDPLLPGRILPSDYLGQQARWPSARTDGGWKCSGPQTGNYTLSTPKKPAQAVVT